VNLRSRKVEYANAKPFPYTIIDGFLDPDWLDAVLAEWPDKAMMYNKTSCTSIKSSLSSYDQMGPATQTVMDKLNSPWFLRELEALTGFEGLIADPALHGGGLHHIGKGGFLNVHVDFNWHQKLEAVRRINLLLYLNRNTERMKNGGLMLYDQSKAPVVTIEPRFNRCVIFNTSEESWHGHPLPLDCAENVARRSLALYYYQKAAKPSYVHNTVYVDAQA
jgi:hypothetical protein